MTAHDLAIGELQIATNEGRCWVVKFKEDFLSRNEVGPLCIADDTVPLRPRRARGRQKSP